MKKLLMVIIALSFSLYPQTSKAQTQVTFYTTMGIFVAQMYDTLQPITSGNFIDLVNEEFYDGVIFHRVIDGFVIQGGDPTGTGYGGPGYTIVDEFDPLASNVQMALGMANSGANTAGSQFYINLVDNTDLDAGYPVFGIVTENFSIVEDIGNVATNIDNRPLTDVVMDSVRVTTIFSTQVNEFKNSNLKVTISPNPTSSFVTIKFEEIMIKNNYNLRILNTSGQIVYMCAIDQSNLLIDFSSLGGSSTYFVQVYNRTEETVFTKKIILN